MYPPINRSALGSGSRSSRSQRERHRSMVCGTSPRVYPALLQRANYVESTIVAKREHQIIESWRAWLAGCVRRERDVPHAFDVAANVPVRTPVAAEGRNGAFGLRRFGRRGGNVHDRAVDIGPSANRPARRAHGAPNAEPWSNGVRATARRDIDGFST